jgi:hypothetical protein
MPEGYLLHILFGEDILDRNRYFSPKLKPILKIRIPNFNDSRKKLGSMINSGSGFVYG